MNSYRTEEENKENDIFAIHGSLLMAPMKIAAQHDRFFKRTIDALGRHGVFPPRSPLQ